MSAPQTQPLFDCSVPAERTRGLTAAARAVRAGELVVLPTDTVFTRGTQAYAAKGGRFAA